MNQYYERDLVCAMAATILAGSLNAPGAPQSKARAALELAREIVRQYDADAEAESGR